MNLKTYITSERGRAVQLASKLVGVSLSYLSQMASGKAQISPKRCVEIERATEGLVTRQDLKPDEWREIWPELKNPRRAKVTPP